MITMNARLIPPAFCEMNDTDDFSNSGVSATEIFVAAYADAIVLTKVKPTWMVARRSSGFFLKFSIMSALRLPFFASCLSRVFRREMTAISVPEKNPFNRMRAMITAMSEVISFIRGLLYHK